MNIKTEWEVLILSEYEKIIDSNKYNDNLKSNSKNFCRLNKITEVNYCKTLTKFPVNYFKVELIKNV